MDAIFDRKSFNRQSVNFRIGAIVSDGMWWDREKWRKAARVQGEELDAWIEENLQNGMLKQATTGAKSYHFPLKSIYAWYEEQKIPLGVQLVEFLFPPRIWDGMTETEGFARAPRRSVGNVTYSCATHVAREVIENLRGIARVREVGPNKYRAYSLDSDYVKSVVNEVFARQSEAHIGKVYARLSAQRRELVDFTPTFMNGLTEFYRRFAPTLIRSSMDTVRIYLPEPEDQDSKITDWVFMAIEKFDERKAVPFSGYLHTTLGHWVYDLPYEFLGKDLSDFQRNRSKAIKSLKSESTEKDPAFNSAEIAERMGISRTTFDEFEERHRVWLSSRQATQLTWSESADERSVTKSFTGGFDNHATASDIALAHQLSVATVMAAIKTGHYRESLQVISQIDVSELDASVVQEMDPAFVRELGDLLGVVPNA